MQSAESERQKPLEAWNELMRFASEKGQNAVRLAMHAAENRIVGEYLEVQRWVGFGFVNPDAAATQLAYALEFRQDHIVARATVSRMISALSAPLFRHTELLTYAAGINALHDGNSQD